MWSEVGHNFPGRGMACGKALGRVGVWGVLCPLRDLKECLWVVIDWGGGDEGGASGSGRVLQGGFRMVYPGLGFKRRNDIIGFAFSNNHCSYYTQSVGWGVDVGETR